MVHPVTGEPVLSGRRSVDELSPAMTHNVLHTGESDKKEKQTKPPARRVAQPILPNSYARFRLQEHIKILAKPKAVPICGPRSRELSNIVLEQ